MKEPLRKMRATKENTVAWVQSHQGHVCLPELGEGCWMDRAAWQEPWPLAANPQPPGREPSLLATVLHSPFPVSCWCSPLSNRKLEDRGVAIHTGLLPGTQSRVEKIKECIQRSKDPWTAQPLDSLGSRQCLALDPQHLTAPGSTTDLELCNRAALPGNRISEKETWNESINSCGFGSRFCGLMEEHLLVP